MRNKEYIKDSRGVYTRRFAYHEMNYHQMMDFVMSGVLTGRYQMFMSAGEAASSPRNIVHDDTGKVTTSRKPSAATGAPRRVSAESGSRATSRDSKRG